MAKIIMTERQYVERLQIIAERKTRYSNKYPYNLLYINKDGRTSGDCLNTIKALLNGYNVFNNAIGYYQKDLSNTGDVTEQGLLKQCSEVSQDFSNLGSHPLLLYMKGHVGSYLGKEVGEYNVIECTKSFGGGVVYSWVDADGTRRSKKGGIISKDKKGNIIKWTHHGKFTPWVEYEVEKPKEEKPKEEKSGSYYYVKNGDTLSSIAKKFGLTMTEIAKLNPQIKNLNVIHVGDKIVVEVIKIEYTVRKGDTLSQIARNHGMTLKDILELNPQIKDANKISIGQTIRVK